MNRHRGWELMDCFLRITLLGTGQENLLVLGVVLLVVVASVIHRIR